MNISDPAGTLSLLREKYPIASHHHQRLCYPRLPGSDQLEVFLDQVRSGEVAASCQGAEESQHRRQHTPDLKPRESARFR